MGTRQGLVRIGQRVVALVATVLLMCGTVSCAKPTEPTQLISEPTVEPNRLTSKLAEVSPPETVQTLKQIIDAYTPQVRILSPRPGEIVEDTSISLRVQVRGLPIFQDETFGLGPHLHVFLDNQPYRAVYDLSEPLEFKDLSPGTHTLRVFASRPWHESFKNQGAFDQRTFHIYAPTPQDELSADKPVLTYSRPQGSYGAEPIMLDFYLTNAPLHMTAQEDADDDIHDWRIRCTVNGQSFVFDEWQAVYLKGFEPGRNWVQLELIDEAGNPIDNRFNNTVRVIDYEPGGDDTLSRLVRGDFDITEVAGIIDPTYEPPAAPEPEPEVEEVVPEAAEVSPEEEEEAPKGEKAPTAKPEDTPETKEPGATEAETPEQEAVPPEEISTTEAEEGAPDETQPAETVEPPTTLEAGEPTAPKSPEASELVPEVTPEEIRQGETSENPEAEAGLEAPSEVMPDEPEAPATESKSPAPPEENLEPSELTPPTDEGSPDQADPVDDTLQAPASLSIEAGDGGNSSEPSAQVQPADEALPPSTEKKADGSTQASAEKTDELEQAAENSTGNKLLERYKRWQKQRQLAQQESEQSTPESDSDRVDVFLSPNSAEIPKLDIPEEGDSDDSRMEMPELVEPYLTEPYLTEPRLDVEDPSAGNEQSGSEAESPNSTPDQQDNDTQKDTDSQPNPRSAPGGDKPFI